MFLRSFTAIAGVILLTPSVSVAQEKQQSYLRKVPSEIEREDPRVQALIDRAEDYFRKGELNLKDGKREAARRDFDESVDTILKAGMDVRSNPRLQNFYLQLVERVYRLENPVPAPGSTAPAAPAEAARKGVPPPAPKAGFAEQKFEPSPRDELARFELTREELPPPKARSKAKCVGLHDDKLELRGFRLGMTLADVRARVPGLRVVKADNLGSSRASLHVKSNKYLSRHPLLRDVTAVFFEFFDSRLSFIGVVYDDSITWGSADAFATQVASALGLPRGWDRYKGENDLIIDDLRRFGCEAFTLTAGLKWFGSRKLPVVLWSDLEAADRWLARVRLEAERKRRLQEQKRKAFKP